MFIKIFGERCDVGRFLLVEELSKAQIICNIIIFSIEISLLAYLFGLPEALERTFEGFRMAQSFLFLWWEVLRGRSEKSKFQIYSKCFLQEIFNFGPSLFFLIPSSLYSSFVHQANSNLDFAERRLISSFWFRWFFLWRWFKRNSHFRNKTYHTVYFSDNASGRFSAPFKNNKGR